MFEEKCLWITSYPFFQTNTNEIKVKQAYDIFT